MSDDLNDEMAQASTALFVQRGIDAIRAQVHCTQPSKAVCAWCAAAIPQARQLAVPGVELCAGCQDVKEHKGRHLSAAARRERDV
ncbi:TraR/DksA C4-type zinc finger protein [Erwinia piriflorinigrans]|uniref:Protein traR n=1 Tax=Erwinia piriflorinigrans CFBP 5888 TaxID=1161919 RepID=V5Z4L1_9GAMM|nr:TraR/DksA C4-type zinc finger protein [Erwinia piriflorinigrans]CCG85939.1 Protein traR [Erwinia piriflorinigrans CFBP 5888]